MKACEEEQTRRWEDRSDSDQEQQAAEGVHEFWTVSSEDSGGVAERNKVEGGGSSLLLLLL